MSTGERDTADNVGLIHRPDDDERAPIDHAVEHGAGRVVVTVAGAKHLAPQTRFELLTKRTRDPSTALFHPRYPSPMPAMQITMNLWIDKHNRSYCGYPL